MRSERQPLASVIVPVYNTEAYLEACLDSLRAQSCEEIEVLMIDDGSTDGSADILRRYAEEDARFRFFQQENRGVSAARNLGLAHARGKYILFVDSDDRVAADYAADLTAALEQGSQLAVCNYYECYQSVGEERRKDYCHGRMGLKRYALRMACKPLHNYYNMLCNRGYVREIIEADGLRFDEGACYAEDFAFLLDYMKRVQVVQTVPGYDYYYNYDREGSQSKGDKDDRERIGQIAYSYRKYLEFWKSMGWYTRYKKLVQLTGMRMYSDEQKRIDASLQPYLYQKCLRENGFSKADFLFFSALRKVKRLLKGES